MFFPIIRQSSQHDIGTVQIIGGNTELLNGLTDFDQGWGMDENGFLKTGFSFVPATQFEFFGTVLHVIPYESQPSTETFSAQSAVSAALERQQYMTEALSVQTTLRQGKRVWMVTGMKGSSVVRVYLDTSSGAIIAVE